MKASEFGMEILKSKGFEKYFRNTGFLFLEKGARIVVSIVIWALIARYLGVEQFGLFNFALSFVFLFRIIADLGLDYVVVRDLVKNEKKIDEIMGTAFLLKLGGGVYSHSISVVCYASDGDGRIYQNTSIFAFPSTRIFCSQ